MKLHRAAIFLDRDGVVNTAPRERYVARWSDFEFLPGVLKTLRLLKEKKWMVIVVSNQAGVERGLLSRKRLASITRLMMKSIEAAGGRIQAVYYCPHAPEARCACRKPKPGMLRRAARRFSIRLTNSFVIGDHEKDLMMGKAAGCKTILVLSGMSTKRAARDFTVRPDWTARNLKEAVSWILAQGKG